MRAAARELAGRPRVAFAEPDWIRRVDACDPAVCWHLEPEPGANVVQAHQGGATGAGQTVAVVDTGVVSGVGDLDGQVVARLRCGAGGCGPAVATPTRVHGTEVASMVAAADDADGTTGVAPGATIVSYRVDATGGGIPISYLRAALDHIAADDTIDVVNLSLGGSQWSALEREGIDAVLDSGKVVVASAGNAGDRDTTTFAMTSSERGRLRVVIYRYASTTVVRVLTGGSQAAGRPRLRWTGKTSSGAFVRGTFSYVIEASDAAGNTSRSRRHRVRVL